MRTKHEVSEALRHIMEALSACPVEDRNTYEFLISCKVYEALAWVLKREEGKEFSDLMVRMEAIDASKRRLLQ